MIVFIISFVQQKRDIYKCDDITITEVQSITVAVKQMFHFKHKVYLTSPVAIDIKFLYTMRVLNFLLKYE